MLPFTWLWQCPTRRLMLHDTAQMWILFIYGLTFPNTIYIPWEVIKFLQRIMFLYSDGFLYFVISFLANKLKLWGLCLFSAVTYM